MKKNKSPPVISLEYLLNEVKKQEKKEKIKIFTFNRENIADIYF